MKILEKEKNFLNLFIENKDRIYRLCYGYLADKNEVKRLAGVVIDWMRSHIEAKSPFARAFGMKDLVAVWEAGDDPICRSAPHLIITHAPKNNKIASLSCSIALTYLELAALPFGAGTRNTEQDESSAGRVP